MDNDSVDEKNVEERIVGEFLFGLHESDVDPELPEMIEDIMYSDDFGGKEKIIEEVESRLLPEDMVVDDGD